MWCDVIELIKEVIVIDSKGFEAKTEIFREVFANKCSIRASEFYYGEQNGYKLSAMFKINPYDYDNEELIMFENERYKVERQYKVNSSVLELVCTRCI